MSDYTPGPWVLGAKEHQPCGHDLVVYAETEDNDGASLIGRVWCDEANEANARLIAAAPDLYKALSFARSVIKSGEPWTPTCEEVINGALAKASPTD